jgi:hypothetical protein
MFEATVDNSTEKLRLEEKVLESRCMNANIVAPVPTQKDKRTTRISFNG